MSDFVEKLRRSASCIYIAVEKSIADADDLSGTLNDAAAEIERLTKERDEAIRERDALKQTLLDAACSSSHVRASKIINSWYSLLPKE